MTTLTDMMPMQTIPPANYRRFTVEEYHRLIDSGHLGSDDRIELLEGLLVNKMPKNPPHEYALHQLVKLLAAMLPAGWDWRTQAPITLGASEPEPDITIVRGVPVDYLTRHPGPADIGLLVEVSESSLAIDRFDKLRIYARAGILTYWIVNLVDRQIEVNTRPTGSVANPQYAVRETYMAGDSVPVVLDGQTVGLIAVNSLLPTV